MHLHFKVKSFAGGGGGYLYALVKIFNVPAEFHLQGEDSYQLQVHVILLSKEQWCTLEMFICSEKDIII